MVKNALKFTQQGSIEIITSYDTQTGSLVVHVADTGAGIAAEDISRLFSKFGKLYRTAEMNHDGIGLGLTIVKQIVEHCEGQVSVESEGLGQGSLFLISMKMQALYDSDEVY